MDSEFRDDKMKELLMLGSTSFPFSGMDDELMDHIESFERRRRSIRGSLKLSWLFFFLGLVSGGLILSFLPRWFETESDPLHQMLYALWIIGGFLLLLLLGGQLQKLSKRYR